MSKPLTDEKWPNQRTRLQRPIVLEQQRAHTLKAPSICLSLFFHPRASHSSSACVHKDWLSAQHWMGDSLTGALRLLILLKQRGLPDQVKLFSVHADSFPKFLWYHTNSSSKLRKLLCPLVLFWFFWDTRGVVSSSLCRCQNASHGCFHGQRTLW